MWCMRKFKKRILDTFIAVMFKQYILFLTINVINLYFKYIILCSEKRKQMLCVLKNKI